MKLNKRTLVLLVSLAVILSLTVGGTLAYLVVKTDVLTNIFNPTKVEVTISNGTITNTGDIPAYVRVAIVATWQKDGAVYAKAPKLCDCEGTHSNTQDCDYTLDLTGWIQGSDGFYYHRAAVVTGNENSVSAPATIVVNATNTEGYTLSIEVLVSAIQATPEAVEAWSGGLYTIGADGKLIAKTTT